MGNMPGHFLTIPSNYASQQEPLQNGKIVQYDNSNLLARQFDCTKTITM